MDSDGERYTIREGVLDRAKQYVTRDRNKSYGEPDEDFQRIAATLNGLGYRAQMADTTRQLRGHDVAIIMVALKLSRLMWSPTHQDSWDDVAGYAACGSETASLQENRDSMASPVVAVPLGLVPDSNVVPAIREAAIAAVGGFPDQLERMGLFLTLGKDIMCSALACDDGDHTFRTGCRYGIHRRRVDG